MKLTRQAPGRYVSVDGRTTILKEISRQTRRPDEICWGVYRDGELIGIHQATKRDAVALATSKGFE